MGVESLVIAGFVGVVCTMLGAGGRKLWSEKKYLPRIEEYQHALEEGVEFRWLTNPIEVLGDENGWVTGLKCQKMRLAEPDASGRPRPVPIEGSEFVIAVDDVVLAIGNTPNPLLVKNTSGLDHSIRPANPASSTNW